MIAYKPTAPRFGGWVGEDRLSMGGNTKRPQGANAVFVKAVGLAIASVEPSRSELGALQGELEAILSKSDLSAHDRNIIQTCLEKTKETIALHAVRH